MIVEFTKSHNYGGLLFEKNDKLDCPEVRANMLIAAGAVKKPSAKKGKSEDPS